MNEDTGRGLGVLLGFAMHSLEKDKASIEEKKKKAEEKWGAQWGPLLKTMLDPSNTPELRQAARTDYNNQIAKGPKEVQDRTGVPIVRDVPGLNMIPGLGEQAQQEEAPPVPEKGAVDQLPTTAFDSSRMMTAKTGQQNALNRRSRDEKWYDIELRKLEQRKDEIRMKIESDAQLKASLTRMGQLEADLRDPDISPEDYNKISLQREALDLQLMQQMGYVLGDQDMDLTKLEWIKSHFTTVVPKKVKVVKSQTGGGVTPKTSVTVEKKTSGVRNKAQMLEWGRGQYPGKRDDVLKKQSWYINAPD